MQLQIECNHAPFKSQRCLTCNSLFEMAEAKVLVCNNQGKYYGEVCPNCLNEGFAWIRDRFEQLNQPQKSLVTRQPRSLSRSLSIPANA